MSNIKTTSVQLGDNVTATQNFTLRTNNDGTLTLARGNVGATTQDILVVNADGSISTPQNAVTFSARQTVGQSLTASVPAKLTCTTEEYDTQGWYDTATSRFTPLVAGYFHFEAGFQAATVGSDLRILFYKNGVVWKTGGGSVGSMNWNHGSCDMYLNGTTDYAECFVMSVAANTTNPIADQTYFQGHLVAKA